MIEDSTVGIKGWYQSTKLKEKQGGHGLSLMAPFLPPIHRCLEKVVWGLIKSMLYPKGNIYSKSISQVYCSHIHTGNAQSLLSHQEGQWML